jgi:dihydrodipicolinate synthase/N-acetylneuraminate lyase
MDLHGVFPPLVTPFREDGAIDLTAFEANLDSYAAEDLAGYLVLGSNGEAASLAEDEKLALVRTARGRSAGRTLLVGTGLESTRATIELTRRVADLGADAALVLTPHYYKPQMTVDALRRHFEAVAEASPIPVLLYSVPQFTGLPFQVPLAAALATHPRVRGMKESSGDVGLLGRIVTAVAPGFQVLCGSAPVFYPALCQGAVGGVLAAACCAPRAVIAVLRAFRRGDHQGALAAQRALTPLAAAVTSIHGVAGLKMAMDVSGRRGGFPRAPLLPAPDALRGELRRLLDAAEAAAA